MPEQSPLNIDRDDSGTSAERDRERDEYLERLREYLKDPEFRAIEGFPIGEDEAILALSDPPYYTACPNPFLPEIITRWQREREEIRKGLGLPGAEEEDYHREPYAADVSEGKNDPIYNAHSYHTKVPHKAIMRYILHYTDPGDVVFDGFCGTGMTGVAAQLCGDRETVEALGYRVDKKGTIYEGMQAISRLGARRAVLNDLSPAATFIAYNYNTPVEAQAFVREAHRILREVERECGWMYETWHPHCDDPDKAKGRINYTVWSDIFVCPECGREIVFWDAAVDKDVGKVRDAFPCPGCGAEQTKRSLQRAWETVYDRSLGQTVRRARQVPVLVNYSVGRARYEKAPDADDLALLLYIEQNDIPHSFPTDRMPEGGESRRNDGIGITHVHQFWLTRTVLAMTTFHTHSMDVQDPRLRHQLLQVLTSVAEGSSRLNRERVSGLPSKLSGTLYVSSMVREIDTISFLRRKAERFANLQRSLATEPCLSAIQTSSSTDQPLSQVDYIFTDPPFGGNLMYSELNFLWEAWLGVFTNNQSEAVVNKVQRKALSEYQRLMERCFDQFYRSLKPSGWMTVEFHNSRNAVWNAIQEALLRAGFVVADVRTFDKQQGSFKQVTSTGAVKQDLIISAYRPGSGLEARFQLVAGDEEGTWDFIRAHLRQLPSFVSKDGRIEIITERLDYLLYDRMVAFHIQRGATVPLSAPEFYAGLRQRFVERDGMFFLPDQVVAYDQAKMAGATVQQLALFVQDEKSAIQWLRQRLDPALGGAPQTYQDVLPAFLQDLHQARHEALPELREVLEANFLQDERGRWYVADPARAGDLEKVRLRGLLREFDEYLKAKGRLRQCRMEAVRAGFARAWQDRDYGTIVRVAERLPRRALEEDPDLLMYYDNATLMVE